ncbi:MAG: SPFH domain-containing protein [Myxococcales bacterium]|nr:SPFH domain-containing protein [Myxococcales bacterium]
MSDIEPKLPLRLTQVLGFCGRLLLRLMRRRGFWIAAGILFVVWVLPASCTTYVPPEMAAVKQSYYGSGAGIKRDVYGPGLHFVTSGVERLHLFPRNLQVVNFSDSTSEVSSKSRTAPSIKIQTNDGYNVQLDVTVLYRLEEPYLVFVEAGPGTAYEDRLIIPRVDRILRKTLGELNSEEFYQGPKRIEKSRNAHEQLATELKVYGVKVDAVLVRRYVYDERYQQLIEGRKIKDQTVYLRQAEAKEAIEQRKRDTATAEGAAAQQVELSRGRAEVEKLRAQADLYKRKRASEGTLLVDLAEAKGTELANQALQGAGSENLVGLKMADTLRGVKVLIVPSDGKDGVNPLDLPAMLRKFEVR